MVKIGGIDYDSITFQELKLEIVADPYCPKDKIYFVNPVVYEQIKKEHEEQSNMAISFHTLEEVKKIQEGNRYARAIYPTSMIRDNMRRGKQLAEQLAGQPTSSQAQRQASEQTFIDDVEKYINQKKVVGGYAIKQMTVDEAHALFNEPYKSSFDGVYRGQATRLAPAYTTPIKSFQQTLDEKIVELNKFFDKHIYMQLYAQADTKQRVQLEACMANVMAVHDSKRKALQRNEAIKSLGGYSTGDNPITQGLHNTVGGFINFKPELG